LPKQSAAAYSPVWVVSLITLPSTVIEHLTGPVVAAARALGIEDHRRHPVGRPELQPPGQRDAVLPDDLAVFGDICHVADIPGTARPTGAS